MAEPTNTYDDEEQKEGFYKDRSMDGSEGDSATSEKDTANDTESLYKPDSQTADEKKGLEKMSPTAKNLYRNKVADFTGVQRFKFLGKSPARRWIVGSLGFTLIGGLFSLLLSFLPLELLHISEVFSTEIGGIQDTVLTTRSGRIYSRMFFFNDERTFDGYKDRGSLFSFLKNRSSNKLLADMRERGFKIDADINAEGRWTGRFNSISWDGADEIIDSDAKFQSFWEQRSKVQQFFKEKFPEKSRFWRYRKAKKVYSRFSMSILRGDWLRNNRVARAIDDVELRMRKLARDAFIGSKNIEVDVTSGISTTDEEGNIIEKHDGFGDVEQAAEETRQKYEDPSQRTKPPDLDQGKTLSELGGELAEGTSDAAKRAAASSLSIVNGIDNVCEIKRVLVTVEVGSRVIRAIQLMKYAGMFLALADSIKAGEAGADEIGTTTQWANTPSEQTGRDLFGGGAWAWAAGLSASSVVFPTYRNNYAIGGGKTGVVAELNRLIDSVPSGNLACRAAGNWGLQIGGAAAGIFAAGGTFGGSLTAQVTFGLLTTAAVQVTKAIFTPILTSFVAGTVMDYFEVGDEMGAALLSGYNVLNGVQSSNHGMRPITTQTYTALQQKLDETLRFERSQKSFYARLFDTSDYNSLSSRIAYTLPRSTTTVGYKIKRGLSDPLSSFASLFQLPFNNNRAFATISSSSQCNDEDIVNAGLATDPFCNVIFGESLDVLDQDPAENLVYMYDRGYVDGDGQPRDGSSSRLAATNGGKAYRQYLNQCNSGDAEASKGVGVVDVLHNYDDAGASLDFVDMCLKDSYNFGDLGTHSTWRFRLFQLDTSIIDAIEEDFDNDFSSSTVNTTGSVVNDNQTINLEQGLELPPNFDNTPTIEGYYRMPSDAPSAQSVGINAPGNVYNWSSSAPENSRCGSQTLIATVYTVAKRWKAENPNSTIVVGDLNEEAGHVSHNYGVDVDITVTGTPDAANTSQDPNSTGSIRLAQMFADTNVVEVIGYQDSKVIDAYDNYARTNDLNGYVGWWSGHMDHFHVRILDEFRDEDGDGHEERSTGCNGTIDGPTQTTGLPVSTYNLAYGGGW